MDDPVKDRAEIDEIRRAVRQLRSELDLLCLHDAIGFIGDTYGFDRSLVEAGPIGEGDRIFRKRAIEMVKRRLDVFERRVADLEEHYGGDATFN